MHDPEKQKRIGEKIGAGLTFIALLVIVAVAAKFVYWVWTGK